MADTMPGTMTHRADKAATPTDTSRRRSPAAGLAQELVAGSSDALRLVEVPFHTQIGLRATPGSPSAAALEQSLGFALPTRVGEVTGDGARHVLWLGPDEFLLVAPEQSEPAAAVESLATALGDRPGQVVDLSANRAVFELRGPAARQVLDKSCRLDLHPRSFAVGSARATLLESTGVLLWRTAEFTWRIMPRSSYSTHVGRWLLDGMREFVA